MANPHAFSRSRATWRLAAALALLLAALALSPSNAMAQGPPAAPTGLTATAGDGSVTLAWTKLSDTTITGLQYSVNHNDTPTGNLSGWGPWLSIPRDVNSYTFRGLTNGREYRYRLRAVNSHGAGTSAPTTSPWFVAATPGKLTVLPPANPPDAPSSVSVTRGDFGQGILSVSWPAVDGAFYYNVRSSEDGGQTWTDGASLVFATSVTVTGVSDSLPVIAAVQAVNSEGASAWTQSPVANVECPVGYACITGAAAPSPVTVSSLGTTAAKYDADGDGEISRAEVIEAIGDYLGLSLTRDEVMEVIGAYLSP